MENNNLLITENLTITFGGLKAVCDVNFQMGKGEIVGLIGPNGSGKTTFFNLITGIYKPVSGRILFEGEEIAGLKPFQIARKGIARTFQNNRLFRDLSVLDNIIIGMHKKQEATLFGVVFNYQKTKSELSRSAEEAGELLRFFSEDLFQDRYKLVADLPHADRKRVEICRALASDPRLLLLDEASAGMIPKETEELMEDIRRIREKKKGISLIVIEHDMEVIEKTADRVVVFNYGWKIAEGPFSGISKDQKVIEAYLGEELEDASS